MATGYAAAIGYAEPFVSYVGEDSTPTQLGVSDLRIDLLLTDGSWNNITSSVRTEDGVRWGRGCSSEDASSSPSWAGFTLDNHTGNFSPRNTAGIYYGSIRRNTPVRIGLGKPVVAEVATGTGSTLTLPQVAQSNGFGPVGVMAVGALAQVAVLTGPSGYSGQVQDSAAAMVVRRGFTTDSDVVTASDFGVFGSPGDWAAAHIAVPGGTLTTSASATADTGGTPSSMAIDGLPAGSLLVAVCAWSADPYGRMGNPLFVGGTAPAEVYLVADSGPGDGPRVAVWAWRHREGTGSVGMQGANDGTTSAAFTVAVWSGAATYSPRFTGEIADWPQSWTEGEHDKTCEVTAGGVMRRLAQSQGDASPLRAALGTAGDLLHYWPMEDLEGATSFAPAIGTPVMSPVNGIAPDEVRAIAGSLGTPSFTGRGARGRVSPANPGPWGFGGVVSIPEAGTATGTNLLVGECATGGDISSFGLEYTNSTTLTVKASYVGGTTASSSLGSLTSAFPAGVNGRQLLVYVAMAQDGADVDWSVTIVNITTSEVLGQLTAGGTLTSKTLGPLAAVTACVEAGTSATIGTNDISVAHVFVTGGAVLHGSLYRLYAARGWAGARILDAAWAMSVDAGIRFGFTLPTSETLLAGPLEAGQTLGNLRLLADAGQGLLSDAAGFPGLEYRPITATQSQEPVYVFDYDNDTFTNPFAPVDDDAVTRNDVEVTSTAGGAARVVVEVGELGAQPGGVGRYADSFTLPVADADRARDLAGWLTNLGTFDAARWPQVGIRMGGEGVRTWALDTFSIGDTVRLDNLPSFSGPTSVDLVVVGISEALDSALYTVTLITRPAGPYRVLVWDDAEFGVWADADNPDPADNRWSL